MTDYRAMAKDLNAPTLKCVGEVLDKAMSGVLAGVHEEVRRTKAALAERDARIAELEAGIGRLEPQAQRYLWLRRCALSGTPAFAYGMPRPLTEAEFDAAVDASINFRHELGCPAAAITASRHDCTCDPLRITHEEGRGNG